MKKQNGSGGQRTLFLQQHKRGETEEFLAFPLLAILARRPMTSKEISQILLSPYDTVRQRLKTLEELGWIVKRQGDGRWVMIVRLAPLGVPRPQGVPGVTPMPEEPAGPGPVTSNVVLEPVGEARTAMEEALGSQGIQASSEAVAAPVAPHRPPGELVAAHFNVPAELDGMGANAGSLENCSVCGARTPLKYGTKAVCPKCARVWGSVGER